jgi:hypothetical protein
MQISLEGKISILVALVGLAGAGAIMIAPEKLWIGWSLIVAAVCGGSHAGPYQDRLSNFRDMQS